MTTFALVCQCGHEWLEHVELPMTLTAFCSRLKGMSCCPKCSGRKIKMLLGERYFEAVARLNDPLKRIEQIIQTNKE